MKKIFFTLLAALFGCMALAQNIPPVDGFKLEAPQDYRNADSAVMQVSRYFLSIPIDQDTNSRLHAGVFLVQWMEGTPEFNFTFSDNQLKYIEKDADLLTLYYASLCYFAIQHPAVRDGNTVTLNAVKLMLAYIKNSKNHVTLTRKLKKLEDADDKGELKSLLKL